jgi:hypothetical protein
MSDVVEEDLDRPVTYRDFNALVQLFKEERAKSDADRKERDVERAKSDADRKERDGERAKADAEKAEIEEERADMQKKWDEGKMLDFLLIFFKIHKGPYSYKQLVHIKAE